MQILHKKGLPQANSCFVESTFQRVDTPHIVNLRKKRYCDGAKLSCGLADPEKSSVSEVKIVLI